MKLRTLLDLCRISNLPTVWSNVLVGAFIAPPLEAPPDPFRVVVAGFSGSLFYSGGMLLNDAFDADIDARERPDRPIPSGRVAKGTVLALGYAMLGLALAILTALAFGATGTGGVKLVGVGMLTALGVLVYNRWHKGIVWSPVVMGFCRACLYAMGAFAVSPTIEGALIPAVLLWGYVVGLTHVARFENASAVGRTWPTLLLFLPAAFCAMAERFSRISQEYPIRTNLLHMGAVVALSVGWTLFALRNARKGGRAIGRAVVALIAGISLVDATFLIFLRPEAVGALVFALAAFVLTLVFQRWVSGT
jgi:4-hydroxybenzoate polyprenyltransferase